MVALNIAAPIFLMIGLTKTSAANVSLLNNFEIVATSIIALIIALILGEKANSVSFVIVALILGFFAYGLSIFFYIYAQRYLGAAKTSAYYAVSPFIGAGLSLIIFREIPTLSFLIALFIMIIGMYFASTEEHKHEHHHSPITHEHSHSHDDGHHNHVHKETIIGKHTHIHTHFFRNNRLISGQ